MALIDTQQRLASMFQRQHALLTRSGSMAIIAALNASGIKQNSKVVIPASCCPIVLFAIQLAGFEVVIADVSMTSLSMEVEHIDAVYREEVAAIIAVHGYGHYCDIEAIVEYANNKNIIVIEDACLAYGGFSNGKAIGSFGDVSVVSFGYDKPINLGYGGAVLVNSKQFDLSLNQFISDNRMSRFADMSILPTLNSELELLPNHMAKRKENIAFLEREISHDAFIKMPYNNELVYWRYPLLVKNRAHFLAYAEQKNVLFTSHYKSLSELQTSVSCPNAERIGNEMINLFVRHQTPQRELDAMVQCINEYVAI